MKKILSVILALVLMISIPLCVYAADTPKATSITSVTAKVKGFKVYWKKVDSVSGYQIKYSTNSGFKSSSSVTIKSSTTTSKKITNLKAKKKYYIKVRTYKTVNGSKKYSSWSKVKSITTKSSTTSKSRTVYITPTGKRYHYDNHCNGGTYIKSTMEEAKKRGLTPCQKCCV